MPGGEVEGKIFGGVWGDDWGKVTSLQNATLSPHTLRGWRGDAKSRHMREPRG